jgi:hypothetical protein
VVATSKVAGSDSETANPPRRQRTRNKSGQALVARLTAAETAEAAERLLHRHLAKGSRPYSAIEAEARAANIPIDALAVAANTLRVVTVDERWQLPSENGHAPAPLEPSPAVLTEDGRAALIRARRLLREQLADGPKPERAVEIAFAEQGLKNMLLEAADRLGVRCQRGQWWLPG